MKPRIILITGSFPYGHAETFLESEVPYLSEYFRVVLLPLRQPEGVRPLPPNVVVDSSLAAIFDVPNRKFTSLLSATFYRSLWYHLRYAATAEAIKRINTFNSEYRAVKKWLVTNNPTDCTFYSYWLNGTVQAITEYKVKQENNVRVVTRVHGYDAYANLYNPPFFPYRKQLLAHIDQLYPISEAGARELLKQGADSSKIYICRLGTVDHHILNKASDPGEGIIRIVSVSNIYPVKRVELIAQAVVALAQTDSTRQVVWHHFGDGLLKESVLAVINAAQVSNLTYKLWGHTLNKSLFDYYRTYPIDVFINLSRSEGIPVSIMEVQSAGIPVVATDVGGTGEIVIHQQNGYLLPANPAVEEVVEGVLYVYQHFKEHQQREQIKAQWKEEYSAEKAYRQFCGQLMHLGTSYSETIP
ncbi:glycosyltransferase [Telluribacter sp.]|jgi:glycosyltransferase involved in cell wall biosynthesis|uniref:glycosyltransferase n=1 Tax=Telluribacter sp. TaxID=1978767 RepID=UPI002E1219E4|nr:glycosyltransferase [Telluribacter sp.]